MFLKTLPFLLLASSPRTKAGNESHSDVGIRDIWGCNIAEDVAREMVPFRVCSSPVESVVWANETLVGIFDDIKNELECWAECEQEPACNFYSYNSYNSQQAYH